MPVDPGGDVPDDKVLWDALMRSVSRANRGRASVLDRSLNDMAAGWPDLDRADLSHALERVLAEQFEQRGLLTERRHLSLSEAGREEAAGRYAGSHLTHVLVQLLEATSMWAAEPFWVDRIEQQGDARPVGVMVVAEYAAFTHQRALYEVFCAKKSRDGRDSRDRLGHPEPLDSEMYVRWNRRLNSAVAHLASRAKDPVPHSKGEELHNQVAALTMDLLGLWRTFAERSTYDLVREAMAKGEQAAVDAATGVFGWMGVDPVDDWALSDPFDSWEPRHWPPAR